MVFSLLPWNCQRLLLHLILHQNYFLMMILQWILMQLLQHSLLLLLPQLLQQPFRLLLLFLLLTYHHQYVYDQFGNKIEEITYYDNDKVKYKNKINNYGDEDKQPIGFPRGGKGRSLEDEELFKETTINDSEGNRVTEDGYAIRTFNKNNILLKWEEKKFKIHWFEYSYY